MGVAWQIRPVCEPTDTNLTHMEGRTSGVSTASEMGNLQVEAKYVRSAEHKQRMTPEKPGKDQKAGKAGKAGRAGRAFCLGMTMLTLAPLVQAATAGEPAFLVLSVRDVGGFVPQQYLFDRLPTVAVYSDGTVLAARTVQTAIYPGPAAPTIVRKISAAAVPRIVNAATKAGATNPKFDFGSPPVADVSSTEIVTRASRGAPTTKLIIYALNFTYGLTKSQIAARNDVAKFIDDVANMSGTLIWTKNMPSPWVSTRWAYAAAPALPDSFSVTRPWFGAQLKSPVSCALFTSTENSKLRALLPTLNQASRWTSAGKTWQVRLRPLFPHENSCGDFLN